MAKTSVGVLGKKRGVIGGLMFRVVDGMQIISSYNPRKFNPKSAAQTLHRAKFTMLSKNAAIFADACYYGFVEIRKPLQTMHSIFIHENWHNIQGSTPDELTPDYYNLVLSKGSLPNVTFSPEIITGGTAIEITWVANTDTRGTYGGDRVQIIIFNETKKDIKVCYAYRNAERIEIDLGNWMADNLYIYGFCLGMGTNNKNENSYTECIGTI